MKISRQTSSQTGNPLHGVIFFLLLWLIAAPGSAAPQTPHQTTLRQDGALLIDGQPTFPIGITTACLGQNLPKSAELGFNIVVGSGDVPDSYYDRAHQLGLYVIGGHYIWATFAGHDEKMDLFQHEKAGFNLAFQYRDQSRRTPLQTLAQYRNHPAVIGWYLFEEPKANLSEPLEHMYEIFKSHAPGHLVTGASCDPGWFHHFQNTVDVLMVDCYPYRPGPKVQPEILTWQLVAHAVEVMRGKPVWIMAQGGCMWKNWDDYPPMTLANYRNQAYLALIAGAQGYILYSYPTVNHFGRLDPAAEEIQWQKIKTVVDELKKLSPILCDGRVSENVRIAWDFPQGKGLLPPTRLLEYYGKHYLLVANVATTPIQAKILGTNYGFPAAFDVKVFTGSAGLAVNGQVIGDAAQTVNESQTAPFPQITVPPDSAGVFELVRRPATPAPLQNAK